MSLPRWVPVALLGAILAVAAAGLLFSTFMVYDDEGYVLFSLKTFAEGGGLYERVYSQYGPFFFLFNQALHFIGFDFTNNAARLMAMVCWLGATGFSGALVWRLTRSTAATMFTLGGVFLHLWPMISEPSHPGGFIVLTTAATAWLGVRWLAQPRKLALAVGLLGAALLLTKINVGVFLFAGAGVWWLLHLGETFPGPRVRTALAVVALALLPVALMRGQLEKEWVAVFATLAAAAGVSTVLATARGAEPLASWRQLPLLALSAGLLAAGTFVAIVAQGTSWRGLLDGVLLGPLRHPQAYTAYVKWRAGVLPLALGSVAFAAWAFARPSVTVTRLVAFGRLAAATIYFATWAFTLSLNTHAFVLSYGLGLVWLFVFPLDGDRSTQPARAWLALLLVPQALHAYPVAGSQISWGTFLWIPLATLAVHDALRVFAAGWMPARKKFLSLAALALMLVTTVRCANYAWVGFTRWRGSDPTRLPGISALRLPENFTTTLRVLARNTVAHADLLFSLPGMHSFHLWTDVPPPTSINATHWFTLLTPAQQEAIRARLEASPRSCVIVQRDIYDFLVRTGIATESPLTVWLHANYESAFALETYEFWVRKGRHIAALGTATAREAVPGGSPRYQIALTLAERDLPAIASIELARVDQADTGTAVMTWTNANAQLTLASLNSSGAVTSPANRVTFPFAVAEGLVRLELLTDVFPENFPTGHGVIYLRDAAGRKVAEARFVR